MAEQNWSETYTYGAARIHRPESMAELQRLVRDVAHIRAVGARHCFNGIADSPGVLVDLNAMPAVVEVDAERRVACVSAGIRYSDVAPRVQEAGYALHNMASLPHITVAGAIATGTHGSGDGNRSLAGTMAGMEIIDARGRLRWVRRGDADFDAMAVGLGAFGIVTRVELDIQPSFRMRQDAFEGVTWDVFLADMRAVTGAGYSVSVMTRWGTETLGRVWVKTRIDGVDKRDTLARLGARTASTITASGNDPALIGLTQFGAEGHWSNRMCHFEPESDLGGGVQIQSEYILPRAHAAAAIGRMRAMAAQIDPLLVVSEIRTVAAEDAWLSSSYGHDVVALHFTWQRDHAAVEAITRDIEATLLPLGARPHWGKMIHADALALARVYPRLRDFVAVARRWDPEGKFRNAFLERHVFGTLAESEIHAL